MVNENNSQPIIAEEPNMEVPPKKLKDKIIPYVKENWLLIALTFVVVFAVITFVYFKWFYRTDIEVFADKFCTCAESSQGDFYNYAKDGFGYKSDLNGCFAEEFKTYGEYFNKVEKKILLEQFQQQVVKQCPEKLDKIFDYQ